MSIRFWTLVAITLLGSSAMPQAGVGSDDASSGRMEQLFLVTFINGFGEEIIAQAPVATGELVPLIAADQARLKSITEAGQALAKASNMRLKLIRFYGRRDVAEFTP